MEFVEVCSFPGSTGTYKAVERRLFRLFMGLRTKITTYCDGHVHFQTQKGISENERQGMENIIRGLIVLFGVD